MGQLIVKSTVDGNVFDYADDGHQKGKPNEMMPIRAMVAGMLRKQAPDGGPAFKLLERPGPVKHANYTSAAFVGDLWNDGDDDRLEAHKATKDDEVKRRPRGTTALPLAASLKKQADTTAAATKTKAASGAGKKSDAA